LGARTYDISADGVFGYHATHGDSLLEHLEEAVEIGGGVIIRQFQAKKVLAMMPAGPRLLPVKHVFGVSAGEDRWIGLSSEEMRAAQTTDFKREKHWSRKKRSATSIGPLESRRGYK
jgi:hypothetical protein